MNACPVIAVFDIGKTNKKLLLFDEDYHVVHEEEASIPLMLDEDGIACDNLLALTEWVLQTFERVAAHPAWLVKALNFSTFGASFVHLDEAGRPISPLYSYLKPIPAGTSDSFYKQFGEAVFFALQTGSPILNMLNSGIQLYWLKRDKPELFSRLYRSLHLPQYMSYLFTGKQQADITSVGCHTGLWDMHHHAYHDWLEWEGVSKFLPAVESYQVSTLIDYKGQPLIAGIGLHDSSASLLPFTLLSDEPVAILSTGTWNITMLPAYAGKLEEEEYRRDCLYYLLGKQEPVAAARVFLGNEFDHQVRKLNSWFGKTDKGYLGLVPDQAILDELIKKGKASNFFIPETMKGSGPFPELAGEGVELHQFSTFEEAYHQLVLDMAWVQRESMGILLKHSPVGKVYVTGGFAKNKVFMEVLAALMPDIDFYTASVNNGSALGAALALHGVWNSKPVTRSIVCLNRVESCLKVDVELVNEQRRKILGV